MGMQTESDGDQVQIYCPRYYPTEWPCWMKIPPLFNRVHAMLISKKFSSFLRNSSWAEAANTATLLKINLLTFKRDLSPFQQLFGKKKWSIMSLVQNFGWDNSHQTKLANHGSPNIWVGLTECYSVDTYPVYNHRTKKLVWQKTWLSFTSHMVSVAKIFVSSSELQMIRWWYLGQNGFGS